MALDDSIQAALDQFGAASGSIAAVIAQYYKALIAGGVDVETAKELTVEFADQVWEKAGFGN